jgi:signal transduction histidine kinase
VELRGPIDEVPESVHLHLLATLTEALSNVGRHSGAKRVAVTIRAGAEQLTAVVADNGRGLPPDRQESGLANLRRRAEIAGGTMTTTPGPDGTGLVLTWQVPLPVVG